MNNRKIDLLGLSFKRLNRGSYLLSFFVPIIILVPIAFLPFMVENLNIIFGVFSFLAIFILFLIMPFYQFYCAIRRLHDFETTGWWSLILLAPTINFIFVLFLCLKKGNLKLNNYGEPLGGTYLFGLAITKAKKQ